jgi:hypothetical protein
MKISTFCHMHSTSPCDHAQMLRDDLRCGEKYGLREKSQRDGSPLECILLLKHVRGRKWQVRWIDTHPGLVDYVDSAQIVVLWKERDALLKEERSRDAIRRHNIEVGFESDSVVAEAISIVFENVGDSAFFDSKHGSMISWDGSIERLRARSQLSESELSPAYQFSYIDRSGRLNLPYDCALNFARAFCMHEPSGVLVAIEAVEREWSLKASRAGEEYLIPLLNNYRAIWALIRQWCGYDAAVAEREKQIIELEKLVWDAVYVLQKAGHDREAAQLRRRLK